MTPIEKFMAAAKGTGQRVALPEGNDPRVLHAARRLTDEEIAVPLVLGVAAEVRRTAEEAGINLDGIEVVDPREAENLESYCDTYAAARDMNPKVARRMVQRPLVYAGMMVKCGDAATMVAEVNTATGTVIQAGALTVGYAPGIANASSFMLMILPEFQGHRDRPLIFADCAVNIDPSPEALADIALASRASAAGLLDEEPRVALLSFSTKGSADHERVDHVTRALEIIHDRDPEAQIDGELQADAAIIPTVAAKKIKTESSVAGQANVLIFPDLNSGNIAYKLVQYLAGARAIGPFLQGFAQPISDLSRGASVDDIVVTSAVCLAQIRGGQNT